MKKPLVSVIMPAFNVSPFVVDAVSSVLHQTLSDFELLIGNDGSTDQTAKKIKSLPKDRRIRFFDFAQNRGKSVVVNALARKARGKFMCIFDADDIMVNYKLEVSANILSQNPTYSLLYGDAWIIDEAGRIIGPYWVPSRGKRKIDDAFKQQPFSRKRLQKYCFIPQGATLFRTADFRRIGGLDETVFVGEDWDLWLRLTQKKPALYVNVPMYLYRINSAGMMARHVFGAAAKK